MTDKRTPAGLPYQDAADNDQPRPGDELLTEVLGAAWRCTTQEGDRVEVDVAHFRAALSRIFTFENISNDALILRRKH